MALHSHVLPAEIIVGSEFAGVVMMYSVLVEND